MRDREKAWGKVNTLVKLIMFSDFYCGSEKKKKVKICHSVTFLTGPQSSRYHKQIL